MNQFILGIIFALMIIPIADGLAGVVLTFFEMLKSSMSTVIMKNNHKIQNPDGEIQTRPIGFITPEEEGGDTDDDI